MLYKQVKRFTRRHNSVSFTLSGWISTTMNYPISYKCNPPMAAQGDVESYYKFVLPLIKTAGEYFLQSRDETILVENKTTHELVTKYDKNIESTLVEKIKEKYPNHKFIGEEGSELIEGKPTLTDDPTWIIDPVDGTTNFTRKIPLSGISVGLTINKEQVLGIVFIPYLNELYTAMKDHGAYLNGEKIRCSNVTDLKKSLFCYELGVASRSDHNYNVIMTRLGHYVKEVLAVRCFGCPILSQCYVASGKLDAYQCDGLFPWDAAAGTLIVTEAGGCVVDSSGKEFDLMEPNFLVTSTKELSEKYIGIAKCADEERKNAGH